MPMPRAFLVTSAAHSGKAVPPLDKNGETLEMRGQPPRVRPAPVRSSGAPCQVRRAALPDDPIAPLATVRLVGDGGDVKPPGPSPWGGRVRPVVQPPFRLGAASRQPLDSL